MQRGCSCLITEVIRETVAKPEPPFSEKISFLGEWILICSKTSWHNAWGVIFALREGDNHEWKTDKYTRMCGRSRVAMVVLTCSGIQCCSWGALVSNGEFLTHIHQWNWTAGENKIRTARPVAAVMRDWRLSRDGSELVNLVHQTHGEKYLVSHNKKGITNRIFSSNRPLGGKISKRIIKLAGMLISLPSTTTLSSLT